MCDIVIKKDNKRFNFRVAVLPVKENKVLVQKADKDDFYSLIGGRVRLGEETSLAICREIYEELGIKTNEEDLKLLCICENFFTYNDKDFHEILFVYTSDFSSLQNFEEINIRDKTDVKTVWVSVDNLKTLNVKPDFIRNVNLFDQLRHVIIK